MIFVSTEAALKAAVSVGGQIILLNNITLTSSINIAAPTTLPLSIFGSTATALTLNCGGQQCFNITGSSMTPVEASFSYFTMTNPNVVPGAIPMGGAMYLENAKIDFASMTIQNCRAVNHTNSIVE